MKIRLPQIAITAFTFLFAPTMLVAQTAAKKPTSQASKKAIPVEKARPLDPRIDPKASTVEKKITVLTRLPLSADYEEYVWYEILGRLPDDFGVMIIRDMALGKILLAEDSTYRELKNHKGINFAAVGTVIRTNMSIYKDDVNGDHGGISLTWFSRTDPKHALIIAKIGTAEYPFAKNENRVDESAVWLARKEERERLRKNAK